MESDPKPANGISPTGRGNIVPCKSLLKLAHVILKYSKGRFYVYRSVVGSHRWANAWILYADRVLWDSIKTVGYCSL